MEEAKAEWIMRVAVIGAGLMGHGIAQTFAAAGLEVNLTDTVSEVLKGAPVRIKNNLNLMAEAGRLSAERIPEIMARVSLQPDLGRAVEKADFVCESISENLEAKQDLFARLDAACPPRTILTTNSSSLSLSQVGARIARRDKLIATHFLNPPHIIPLVEIMPGGETSEEVLQTTVALMRRCGQAPVIVKKEVPGYIFNRLLAALMPGSDDAGRRRDRGGGGCGFGREGGPGIEDALHGSLGAGGSGRAGFGGGDAPQPDPPHQQPDYPAGPPFGEGEKRGTGR